MNAKVAGLLGICAKAGKIASGAFAAEKIIASGKAKLVLLAEDASEATRSYYCGMCESKSVPCRVYAEREELGQAIGKGDRVIVAVTDEGLAQSLISQIDI